MHRTLILVLLLSACSFAAISRTGSCSAATTNCTLSATATGDLIIVIAARASATPPSLPASNTAVTTRVQGTNSYRVYCRVASSSGDTGTGTATNATRISAVSYSGTSVHATADCPTTGIGLPPGGTALNSAVSVNLNYAALTMNSTDTTSWVVGASYNTASAGCTPSGMSSVTSNGTGPGIIINDTNATVNSWSSTNCTVTSGTWLSWTGEVTAAINGTTGTPTLVQWAGCSSTLGAIGHDGSSGATSYTCNLPEGTQAGNAIVMGMLGSSAQSGLAASTVADDQSNHYILGVSCNDSARNGWTWFYYAQNVAANTRAITFTPSAIGLGFTYAQPFVAEFNNVQPHSAYDGSACTSAATATPQAGSITTTANGNLWVMQVGMDNDDSMDSFTAGTGQTNITWSLLDPNPVGEYGSQWGVQSTAAALNPKMTFSGTSPGNNNNMATAIALKTATQGAGRPAGLRVIGIQHNILVNGNLANTASPREFQMPCQGNLVYTAFVGGQPDKISSIGSDSNSNTWTTTGTYFADALTGTNAFYAGNATCNAAENFTVTFNSNPLTSSDNIMIWDVQGAATSPFDKTATANGTQSTAGNTNPTTTATLTPATANGIIFITGGEDNNCVIGYSGTNVFELDAMLQGNQPCTLGDGTGYGDNDNSWGHYYNPSTSSVTAIWDWSSSSIPDRWAARLDAFEAAPSITTIDSSNGAIIF